ncbi:MAG TPA: MBL fold metallo-hydrolase, partial [Verrucomicrobiae bacterium]|nr:MBL fold metallo-hydrolase [Verrucomicrobiae bacterium]
KADIILIGHEHTDHFDAPTITSVKTATGKIVTTQTVYNSLSTTLRASTTVLANGQSTTISGVEILAVPAYNSNHPQGTGNGYVVTLGGKRIYMSGDTGDIPETRALQNIDAAFLCMNVPYTMTVQQAASVTRAFAPKVVYPYHFRNQDNSLANLNTFKTLVGTDLPIEVRFRKWY